MRHEPPANPIVVVNGRLTTLMSARMRAGLLGLPGLVWVLGFLVLPLLAIFAVCWLGTDEFGRLDIAVEHRNPNQLDLTIHLTTESIARTMGFTTEVNASGVGISEWRSDNVWIILRTLWTAGVTTLLAVAISYPLAFWTASHGPRGRAVLLALVMVPFCTNLVIRTYALREVFGTGTVQVYLGMLAACLPFAALPLYTSVERMDWCLVEAARDLHASRLATFRHAILPQTAPGLLAAIILTFIPACGMFLVTDLMGGGKFWLVGNLIQAQLNREWPMAACLSVCLIFLTLIGLWAMRRWARNELGS